MKTVSTFQTDDPHIFNNDDNADQTALVTAIIDTNLRMPNASSAQKVIIQFLKDMKDPKLDTINLMI